MWVISMRCALGAVAVSCLLAGASVSLAQAPPPPPPIQYGLSLSVSGLDQPVAIANAHDGSGRLFVAERTGAIRIIRDRAVVTLPFLDLHAQVSLAGDAGVLGLAFDPRFVTNRRFFVSYVRASDGALRVSSFLAFAGNPDVADPSSEVEVITIPHTDSNVRYGGDIAFAKDGSFFVSAGDGSNDGVWAQDLSSLLGKLLRLDVSGPSGYTVPGDNYYVVNPTPGARPEIAASGLRDPRKLSFDRATRDLYIGENGAGSMEINTMPADYWRVTDMNYGWPAFEGTLCLEPSVPGMCEIAQDPPQVQHMGGVTGGFVYRGSRSQAFYGFYIYAEHSPNDSIRVGKHDFYGFWYDWFLESSGYHINAFGEDEAGELYYATSDGHVLSIDPPLPAVAPPFANTHVKNHHVDYDGDGKGDITWATSITPESGWQYATSLMDGASIKSSAAITPTQSGLLWDLADFDHDGHTDRLWRDHTGGYWIDLVNGASVLSSTRVLLGGSGWEVVGRGDFNADGKTDLVWRNGAMFGLWLMDGSSASSYGLLTDPDPAYFSRDARPFLFGDFNGDGKTDILWVRDSDGSAAISLMDGLSATSQGTMHAGPTYWLPYMAADFNGDGKTDIVWRWADGAIGIWLMDGMTYSSFGVVRDGGPWSVIYARDLDGDGKADLVWRNDSDGRHEAWLMDGLTVRSVIPLEPGSDWYIRDCDDYDGDGKPDFLWWSNTANGYAISTSIAPLTLTPLPGIPAGWGPWWP